MNTELITLFCTHILVLILGWHMGTKTDSNKILPKTKPDKAYKPEPDDLAKEMLDYE